MIKLLQIQWTRNYHTGFLNKITHPHPQWDSVWHKTEKRWALGRHRRQRLSQSQDERTADKLLNNEHRNWRMFPEKSSVAGPPWHTVPPLFLCLSEHSCANIVVSQLCRSPHCLCHTIWFSNSNMFNMFNHFVSYKAHCWKTLDWSRTLL